jgi:hypothetical protein
MNFPTVWRPHPKSNPSIARDLDAFLGKEEARLTALVCASARRPSRRR